MVTTANKKLNRVSGTECERGRVGVKVLFYTWWSEKASSKATSEDLKERTRRSGPGALENSGDGSGNNCVRV